MWINGTPHNYSYWLARFFNIFNILFSLILNSWIIVSVSVISLDMTLKFNPTCTSSGFNIGSSLCEKDQIPFCKKLLDKYSDKIVLPIDVITAKEIKENVKTNERFINEIEEDEIGLDIGPKTIKVFKHYLDDSKTVFWNGPVGYFEIKEFSKGTKRLCQIISESKAYRVIGGGDTARAVEEMGYSKKMNHISTGGGASLTYLEGVKLKALESIDEK